MTIYLFFNLKIKLEYRSKNNKKGKKIYINLIWLYNPVYLINNSVETNKETCRIN